MKKSLLDLSAASVFFDGTFAEPVRLAHPEGVAVADDGAVWCGTENGHIVRIVPDGSEMEALACTDGFIAGIAFDGKGGLLACDIRHGCLFRYDLRAKSLNRFGTASFAMPNYPVVDFARNCCYVSDSYSFDQPGPGIWRYDLDTGEADIWLEKPLFFANGMALGLDGKSLFVVESKRRKVSRITIGEDGSPAGYEDYALNVGAFPDGLSLDLEGNLYVSCYEPSAIYRVSLDGEVELLIHDEEATLIAHATNTAFRGREMFSTNLGRWHITRINLGAEGPALPLKVV